MVATDIYASYYPGSTLLCRACTKQRAILKQAFAAEDGNENIGDVPNNLIQKVKPVIDRCAGKHACKMY